MKWIKLFEGFTNVAKLSKANSIFGIWLMTGIIKRAKKELKKQKIYFEGKPIHYFYDSGKKVVKYTNTIGPKTEHKVDICFRYSMKLIGDFGREIGLGFRADIHTEDTFIFITYFYKAFILAYGLPSDAKILTTTSSIL